MIINTVKNDLKVTIGSPGNLLVNVLGFAAPGDGGGGDFYWDDQSTVTGDDYNIIQPAAGAGRWIRINPEVAGDDTGGLRICFVQGIASYAEFIKIRNAGFNCLLHYKYLAPGAGMTRLDLCNLALSAGLRMIINLAPYSGTDLENIIIEIDSHPAVIGYYLFDEPDGKNVSISTQEVKINLCRGKTTKRLFTSMMAENQLIPLVSQKFDVYLLSIYYLISGSFTLYGGGGDMKTYNYNRMGTQVALYKEIYAGKTIIPISTSFFSHDGSYGYPNQNAKELIEWQKKFYSYFSEDNSVASFIWDSGGDVDAGMNSNSILRDYAVEINNDAIRNLRGKSQTFIYMTNRPSDLNANELPRKKDGTNDAINDDISYYSIINVGNALDERRQTFGTQGIAVRKNGGTIAYRCPQVNKIRLVGIYHNYGDNTTATFQLLTSEADYYYFDATTNNIQVLATASNIPNLSTIELWGISNSNSNFKSFGIRFTPSTSYPNFFKFLQNTYILGF